MDGVMNHLAFIYRMEKELGRAGVDPIDPLTVARLNRIVEATGAVVVVTSSWRGQYNFQQRLDEQGFIGTVAGETPYLGYSGRQRGDEIRKWLDTHGPVESIAILDDDVDMREFRPFLVKTHVSKGLLDEHVGPVIEMLNKPFVRP